MAVDPKIQTGVAQTLMRLMHSLDRGDIAGFLDCWTEDGDLEVRFRDGRSHAAAGRDAIGAMTAPSMTRGPGKLRHVAGPVEVEEIGDGHVRTFSYCTYYWVGEEAGFAGMGEYRDELRLCPDGIWRVSRRRHAFLTDLNVTLGE
ncbi:MAG: nuclear transport factor 2 family protein [Novosphingobium sp.]|nr:nuclear transport factor 2 family protein [Novosphingobium sp.]